MKDKQLKFEFAHDNSKEHLYKIIHSILHKSIPVVAMERTQEKHPLPEHMDRVVMLMSNGYTSEFKIDYSKYSDKTPEHWARSVEAVEKMAFELAMNWHKNITEENILLLRHERKNKVEENETSV